MSDDHRRPGVSSERGIALVGVLMLLLIVSAASSGLWVSAQTESAVALNRESAAQASAAAEGGANHATDVTLAFLRRWRPNGFATPVAAVTSLLVGPDGASGTAATDADNGSLENFGIPRAPARVALPGPNQAQYLVRLLDEDDPNRGFALDPVDQLRIGEDGQPLVDANNRLLIQTSGFGNNGTMTSLEVVIGPAQAPALVSNGDLIVRGNASVLGTNGNVHSNGSLEVGGSADIDGNATASAGYTEVGHPNIGGSTSGSAMMFAVIDVHASEYRYLADLILTSTGQITDPTNAVICDASGASGACVAAGYTWIYQGADGWRANSLGANADNGTYYAETDVEITGNIGNNGNPWNVTLIAEGGIDISGNSTIEANTFGLLFVTDQDLKMTGGTDQVGAEAQNLIREQAALGGNVSLLGQLVIEDAAAVSDLVTATRIGVSGTPSITNNGTLIGTSFAVASWREM